MASHSSSIRGIGSIESCMFSVVSSQKSDLHNCCLPLRVKGINDDELRFGDEIECGIFVIDSVSKAIKISVRSAEVSSAPKCFPHCIQF